jgi:hypothetical protein
MVILCSFISRRRGRVLGHCGASMGFPELRRVAVTDWNEVMAESIRWFE